MDRAPRTLAFRKMHGLGNDFVILDARGQGDPVTPALARAIGDRHRGVGFDQLAVIGDAIDADARLTFWNPDGSTAGACGNATRCVAHLLLGDRKGPLTLATGNGVLTARRRDDGRIEVDMGPAATDWAAIPLARAMDTVALPLPGGPGAVGMGNPHCVFFVDDLGAVDPVAQGRRHETNALFPERANIGFAQVLAPDHLRLRVWERGAGLTLACGSGACAAVVAGVRQGRLDRSVTVILDGGALDIVWAEDGHVRMTGPVAEVFVGTLSPELLATAR